MTNLPIFTTMVNHYHRLSYTNQYIWGFTYKKVVYMAFTSQEAVERVCKLDRASRGAGYSLRFDPTNAQKLLLMTEATVLCSEEFFNNEVKNSKYNKGEIFEKMITETVFGQEWKKDTVPFNEGGDVEVNGLAYQIKFQKATFCNEKSLANILAKG